MLENLRGVYSDYMVVSPSLVFEIHEVSNPKTSGSTSKSVKPGKESTLPMNRANPQSRQDLQIKLCYLNYCSQCKNHNLSIPSGNQT